MLYAATNSVIRRKQQQHFHHIFHHLFVSEKKKFREKTQQYPLRNGTGFFSRRLPKIEMYVRNDLRESKRREREQILRTFNNFYCTFFPSLLHFVANGNSISLSFRPRRKKNIFLLGEGPYILNRVGGSSMCSSVKILLPFLRITQLITFFFCLFKHDMVYIFTTVDHGCSERSKNRQMSFFALWCAQVGQHSPVIMSPVGRNVYRFLSLCLFPDKHT